MSTPYQAFGVLLRAAMKTAAMDAPTLAKATSIAYCRQIYLWRQGDRRPSVEVLQRLVQALGLDRREAFLAAYPEARWFFEGQP